MSFSSFFSLNCIETMVPALTRMKSGWKPPKNHPWRNRKIKEEIISK